MSLRIALTHAYCWPEVRRGGERYLHQLAAALAGRGHEVTVIAGASRPGLEQEHDGALRVLRLWRPRGWKGRYAERSFGRLVALPLLARSYDVVHSLGVHDAVTSMALKRIRGGRRTVYTCLGLPLRDWWNGLPQGPVHERVVAEVDVYGCLSRYAQRCLSEQYGRAGALTPGGVDLRQFQPVAERAPEPTLLYSGALDVARKGLPELLEAVAVLARTEPRVRLWLSGPGDPSRILSRGPATARERTEVLPLGSLEDQPARYSSAWASVLPSRAEAFGLALVESLACGTPIVANDEGSLPELVEPGCGFVAPARDPEKLAEACSRALHLGEEHDAVDRCRQAAGRHDWEGSVAPAVEALYMGAEPDSAA